MKIRFIRSDLQVVTSTALPPDDRMNERDGRYYWNLGAVYEVPKRGCELLVRNGDAEPADDEAEAVCAGWKRDRAKTLFRREALSKGIHPDDFGKFERGEMIGYDAEGNDVPGPNYIDEDEEEDDDT